MVKLSAEDADARAATSQGTLINVFPRTSFAPMSPTERSVADCLSLLESGIAHWNEWRARHPDIRCNLARQTLSHGYFFEANFSQMNLSGVNFQRACLIGADFSGADLTGADLTGAYLSDATFCGANLSHTNFTSANLTRADLRQAHLSETQLTDADICTAQLPDFERVA